MARNEYFLWARVKSYIYVNLKILVSSRAALWKGDSRRVFFLLKLAFFILLDELNAGNIADLIFTTFIYFMYFFTSHGTSV